MLNLRPLYHFVLVAEEGSFQSAAKRANVTQPALSISIKTLENSIDLVLFERDQRPIKLTVAGREMLRIARNLLFDARNLDQEINNFKHGLTGSLNVGFVPNFAACFGGSVVAEFAKLCDRVQISIETHTNSLLGERLRAEELDLIVCDPREITNPNGLSLEQIPTASAGFFCRNGHPLLSREITSYTDLRGYNLATVNLSPILRRRVAKALGPEFDFEDANSIRSNNVAILRDVAIESDTVLLSLRRSLRHEVTAGYLVEIPLEMPLAGTWAVATIIGKTLHPSARVLADIVRQIGVTP